MDSPTDATAHQPAPLPLEKQAEDGLRPFPWTGLVIFLVVLALIAVAAVPRAQLSAEEMAGDRYAVAARHAISELQAAIEEYELDHGRLPGLTPSRAESLVTEGADATWLVRQLVMSSDEQGETVPRGTPMHPYGPYLEEIPANPINGLCDLRVVPGGALMPEAADGQTGWIYDPVEGEVRLNAPGLVFGTEVRYFDL